MNIVKSKTTKKSENLVLAKTHNTPEINFDKGGTLEFKGRLIPENAINFFCNLINWIKELKTKEVKVNIKLDYINSSSSKCLSNFLKELDKNPNIDSVSINWHYEEDDLDLKETAEIFESILVKTKFNYIEYVELDF